MGVNYRRKNSRNLKKMITSILYDHPEIKIDFPLSIFQVNEQSYHEQPPYLPNQTSVIFCNEKEKGRQESDYYKAKVIELPQKFLDICPFKDLVDEEDLLDAWILFIHGAIPEHSDPISLFHHFRWNFTLSGLIGYNIGKNSIIVPEKSSILFKSDESHSAFVDLQNLNSPIIILSIGLASKTKTKIEEFK